MIRPHSQRLQILELLHYLMLNHRVALQSLGDEAIVGITDLVSGEKDPRSLMIIFSLLHVIMAEWDIAAQAEVCELALCALAELKFLDFVRCCVLLFPNYFSPTTRRPISDYGTGFESKASELHISILAFRTVRLSSTDREARLDIS